MSMDNAPTIPNAVMLDRVIGEIQEGLVANLSWLDVAFGRSQRLTKKMNGKTIVSPNVFCGGWQGHGENDYIEVSPDSKIGNFCFFEIDDPETIDAGPWAREIRTPFSLIFWFDLRRVYGTASNRNVEYLKGQVLHVLNGRAGWHLSEGRVTVARIYERNENIYRGYTLSEIDNQYLMHPYAGFRVDGTLEFAELCFEEYIPPTPPTPVVPDVPPGALSFDVGRFALDSVGDGELFRIRGNSQVIDGTLQGAMIESIDIYGYNQIDPADLRYTQITGGIRYQTRPFRVIPGRKYVVYYEDAFEGQTSNYNLLLSKNGGKTYYDSRFILRGTPITLPDEVDTAFLYCDFQFGAYMNNLIIALYDEEAAGSPVFYKKTIGIDVTKLSGYDEQGRVVPLFSEGLLSAGGVMDEIYEGVAVRRVGMRKYQQGDESNPGVITDMNNTAYGLPSPEVYTIKESLDFTFVAERGGTAFVNPETIPVPLDIVID